MPTAYGLGTSNNLYMSSNDARYKYYRHEISKLTRISKKLYYHEFFDNSLNNLKKTWEGIKKKENLHDNKKPKATSYQHKY